MSMKRVYYHGHLINTRTQDMLERAEARLGYDLTILQGSYHSGVSASAGTHDGGGVVDLAPNDASRKVLVLRQVGFAAWYRRPSQGPWPYHIHAVAVGDPELSSGARYQVSAYYNGRNGLASNGYDDGPHLRPIPVWPVRLGEVDLEVLVNQFTAKNPEVRPSVYKVQKMLNWRYGKHVVAVDGVAGPQTRGAYKNWENRVNAPEADGIPGPYAVSKLIAGFYRIV